MPILEERNAAFDAVKPHVMLLVPAMFHSYVSDTVILAICDDALRAAEKVRNSLAHKS